MEIRNFIKLSLVAVAFVGGWSQDSRTRIIFCDVGQGDGVIVVRNNIQLVVDTGGVNEMMTKCLGN